ncbi:MAG TPA: D-alanine--D-alanine ligase [Bacteroidia bacterium]|nr:D-alanine--D-alanine ligase [Bacteroidia bacterium]
MKIRIGIIFGGSSREREISFAGGRTVYDNLNKSLFEPVPLFMDSFRNFVLLDWQYIYKGSIRDFYPPVNFIPSSTNEFQVYAESIAQEDSSLAERMIHDIGKKINPDELSSLIDFAFLCLHGPYGEDGRIQGLLESYGIPYSGSGIFASAFGMNKALQKKLLAAAKFESPAYITVKREELRDKNIFGNIFSQIKSRINFPCVIKPATQGSSIGVSILEKPSEEELRLAVHKAFFIKEINATHWRILSAGQQIEHIRLLTDIREGIGMPVVAVSADAEENKIIFHPEELLLFINEYFSSNSETLLLEGTDSESEVIIESFIRGKEFSCIIIRNVNGEPLALPPTEVRKGNNFFDYRSKYLPGLSRKITPIDLPETKIENIRKECDRLFSTFGFNVYARIDGFIKDDGTVFLNDPNTTSGMMPSSFFFHQAAEIGLNPSQFLTYIIRTSVLEQISLQKNALSFPGLLKRLDHDLENFKSVQSKKIKVAVILGGYSSERHISVESGRNVFEKLSSSEKYEPFPVFLTGKGSAHKLIRIPVNILLKDNADDISDKISHFKIHPVTEKIVRECAALSEKYSAEGNVFSPSEISYEELASLADVAFIALHGRPGEDGTVQKNLERVGVPYNGSGPETSLVTIDKFKTNEQLASFGFLTAKHFLVEKDKWNSGKDKILPEIFSGYHFPFIVKPVDDGCSSAVKRISTGEELICYADSVFREDEKIPESSLQILNLKPNEEFPIKKYFLIEELIEKNDAVHFLEITGGLLTRYNEHGELEYEIFEPSEALSEGDVLSLEEKFLAGEGQNITPARYSKDAEENRRIAALVKEKLLAVAVALNIEGYARIDAFVRVYRNNEVEVIIIEVNSLPGMTPATCIFHQTALSGYKPYDFIDRILDYGIQRGKRKGISEKVI